MKRKTKNIFKTISLAMCGLSILGGVSVGATQLVKHMKNDLKTINLSYEVGGLNDQGRYEEDKSTIYTKEKFACEGLQAELEFDSSINYEIFYYDLLDNFISSTGVLTDGHSENGPYNGAYARIEITPTEDEDGKVSFIEKFSYASMLNLKVAKAAEENVNKKFTILNGNHFRVVERIDELVFDNGFRIDENFYISNANDHYSATTKVILKVDGYKTLTFDRTLVDTSNHYVFSVYGFSDLNSKSAIPHSVTITNDDVAVYNITSDCNYVILTIYGNQDNFSSLTNKLYLGLSLNK